MSTHTPGPWAARDIDDDCSARQFWISDRDGSLVAEASVEAGAQVEANARLIAAAPDLLDALRLFAGENTTHTEGERMEAARAAIAKATGSAA